MLALYNRYLVTKDAIKRMISREEEGQTIVEYVLLIVLIALVVFAANPGLTECSTMHSTGLALPWEQCKLKYSLARIWGLSYTTVFCDNPRMPFPLIYLKTRDAFGVTFMCEKFFAAIKCDNASLKSGDR